MDPQSKTHRIRLATEAERLARMLKALGNPVRFQIMQTLAERQTCITQEIVDSMPLAQSTISQHLKVLREAGWCAARSRGRRPAIASIPRACAGSRSRSKPGCPAVASLGQARRYTWSLRRRRNDTGSDGMVAG